MQKKDLPFLALKLNKLFPEAKTELHYSNKFQLLIAILLSAQTTDKQVNKATDKLFKILRTPEDGVALGVEKIKSCINTLGFFNNKAKNIFTTCKILVENEGKIPKTIEELLKLPGVGIKTAKVFLAISENAPYIGVDTHVHRVLNRLGLVKTKNPLETDKAISCSPQGGGYHEVTGGVFTKKDHARLHHTLVLFGRYYCTAKKPKCEICAFKVKCDFYKKSQK